MARLSGSRFPWRPWHHVVLLCRKPHTRATVCVFADEARISLLETGRFLSIFSKSRLTLPAERPQLQVLRIEAPLLSRPVGLLYLKNRTLSPATQLFFEHAREVAKPLARKMR